MARYLVERDAPGRIVNITSVRPFQREIRVLSYTASKSGIFGLTRLLVNEWAAHSINLNAIAPGYMATETLRPFARMLPVAPIFWDASQLGVGTP